MHQISFMNLPACSKELLVTLSVREKQNQKVVCNTKNDSICHYVENNHSAAQSLLHIKLTRRTLKENTTNQPLCFMI